MLLGCFAAGGPGAQNRRKERKENYVAILKQHLQTSVRKWKLVLVANGYSKWTMTSNILPKMWRNGLRTTKSMYWSDHHKALTSIP